MTQVTANDHDLARRMFAHESAGGDAAMHAAAAARVYERLADRLAPLIGGAGVRALLARSAKLTMVDFPCFGDLVIPIEGHDHPRAAAPLLAACLGKLEPDATFEAAAALFASLLALLNSLVGERLMRQILSSSFTVIEQNVVKETDA